MGCGASLAGRLLGAAFSGFGPAVLVMASLFALDGVATELVA